MVIEVSYQTKRDAKDPHSDFTDSRFFESDQIPDRAVIVEKLRALVGDDFDENTISIKEYDDEAEAMRKGGIPVPKI